MTAQPGKEKVTFKKILSESAKAKSGSAKGRMRHGSDKISCLRNFVFSYVNTFTQ